MNNIMTIKDTGEEMGIANEYKKGPVLMRSQ